MKRKWLFLFISILIIGIVAYYYIYQPHRNISEENADFSLSAVELQETFSKDIVTAETLYLDKTLIVSGYISEISGTDITIDDTVFCLWNHTKTTSLTVGNTITVKGRCIGYDDLLELVKLDQCIQIPNP